jgi:hypothetical protein
LAGKSPWIHRAAVNQAAAHVDCCDLVESGSLRRVSCVSRTKTPKGAATIPTANIEVAIGCHVE